MKTRHMAVMTSFVLVVLLPTITAIWYLYAIAEDQYSSRVGFSVRSEEVSTVGDFLGSFTGISSGSSNDSDVLFEFIQSQQMVAQINAEIDIVKLFSKPDYDPVFAYDPEGSIEDLLDYWGRMVKIYYDAGTGLIELRVNAFTADDAQRIAQEIFDSSSLMINELSAIAREDSTRYAKEELEAARDQIKISRQDLTLFRAETQIVDPTADVQGQMGLLTTLEGQLAETLIELDLLVEVTRANDPRIEQAKRKILVIQKRIEAERNKFGFGDENSTTTFSALVGQYEALVVDREFAEQRYLAARALYESALAESRRKSRYLAAYVKPTLAETAEYPKRLLLVLAIGLFLTMSWAILVLISYSIKDRR
ncbi:MAG: sugar transporter [Proteobacteria bacterium]|nr:sugar transporter [Pseudomonadota bacterium]